MKFLMSFFIHQYIVYVMCLLFVRFVFENKIIYG